MLTYGIGIGIGVGTVIATVIATVIVVAAATFMGILALGFSEGGCGWSSSRWVPLSHRLRHAP